MATNCGEALELASLTIYENKGIDVIYPDYMNLQEVNLSTNGAFELTFEGLARPKWEREIINSENFIEKFQDTFSFNLLGLNTDTISELNKIRNSRNGFLVRALTVQGDNLVFLTPLFISNNSVININKRSAIIEMRYKVPTFENFKGINLISNSANMSSFVQFVNTFTKINSSSILVGNIGALIAGMPIRYKLNIPLRQNSTIYNIGDFINVDGNIYQAITSTGTSAASPTTFNTELYTDTTDGTQVFRRIKNYFYGLIESIVSNTLNIKGVSLDFEIIELWYTSQANRTITTYQFTDDTFKQIDTDIQTKYDNKPVTLETGKIVLIQAWQTTEDTGLTPATVDFRNDTNSFFTLSLVGDETFNDTGVNANPAYYDFDFYSILRMNIPNAGSEKDTTGCIITFYQITID